MDKADEVDTFSKLLKRGDLLARSLVGEFPAKRQQTIQDAIESLIRRGFVDSVRREGAEYIRLPDRRAEDARNLAKAMRWGDASHARIVGLIPKSHAAPFHIAYGEYRARGNLSAYVLCYRVRDKHDVTCYVIDAQGRRTSIHLGDLADGESRVAQFLGEIDAAFGDRRFTREEIKGKLPHKLTGNNQPTKAAVVYLCHTGYLIRSDYAKGPSKFERTGKRRPVASSGKDERPSDENTRAQTAHYPFYH